MLIIALFNGIESKCRKQLQIIVKTEADLTHQFDLFFRPHEAFSCYHLLSITPDYVSHISGMKYYYVTQVRAPRFPCHGVVEKAVNSNEMAAPATGATWGGETIHFHNSARYGRVRGDGV